MAGRPRLPARQSPSILQVLPASGKQVFTYLIKHLNTAVRYGKSCGSPWQIFLERPEGNLAVALALLNAVL